MKTTRTMLPRVEELEARTLFSATLVKDINPFGNNSSNPGDNPGDSSHRPAMVNVNGTVFFAAGDGANGVELWMSDGTAAGTVLVKDIFPGSTGSGPAELTNVNGTLFFSAKYAVSTSPGGAISIGYGLWKSDGTEAGTSLVLRTGTSRPRYLTDVGGVLYFRDGSELWESDGSTAGTTMIADVSPAFITSPLTNVNGTVFFAATDDTHGEELWKSDGTAPGTVLVKDIDPRTGSYGAAYSSLPGDLTNVNGTLFFAANDGPHGRELWKSDGTAAGTVLVKDINPGGNSYGYPGSFPSGLANFNGTLFFCANDGPHGSELWKSNGTAAGTVLVKDINPGAGNSVPGPFVNLNGTLFFGATTGLWRTDGTTAGTVLVKEGNADLLINVNGTLFFINVDAAHGAELWQSNGTKAGTILVRDITPGPNPPVYSYFSGVARNFTNVNGKLFFSADDGTHGRELWLATTPAPPPPPGARVTAAAFSGTAAGTFDNVLVTFSEAINASSFTTADVTLNGPGGAIAATGVTPVTGSTTEFIVSFQAQSAPGIYTVITGANILNLAGSPMNQNGNGTNGENPGDSFVGSGVLGTPTVPPFFAVGNVGGTVRIVNTTGTVISTIRPLDAGSQQYTGLVEVALGDFNGDGVPDLAVAAADPAGLHGLANNKAGKVFVYDGAALVTGLVPTSSFRTFTPFATTSGPAGTTGAYTNGLNIATGDVNGDGNVDLIAGTRGATAGVGRAEFGRLVVIDGTSPAGSNVIIGGIQTPFGSGYQKGVVVAVGNADGVGGEEIAVTRGGPVASTDPVIQQIKVKVLQLQAGSLTELHLNADGSTSFAPFGSLSGPASAIKRDGRVAFLDADGDGTDELVFTALDPLTNASNQQVRVGVYSINPAASSGAATIVSTGPDAGTYLTGTGVVDHAVTRVPGAGAVETIALLTESVSSGIAYLDPLTGAEQSGGFALSVLHGGITIDVN